MFGGGVVGGVSERESGGAAGDCRVVLLPVLLFRVLRDRKVCGPKLSVFGLVVVCAVFGGAATTPIGQVRRYARKSLIQNAQGDGDHRGKIDCGRDGKSGANLPDHIVG